MTKIDNKLTDKQLMFCQEYLLDLNATQAAIRAGYSAHTANEQGSRLLTNVSVQGKLTELLNARSKKIKIDANQVLAEILKLAMASPEEIKPSDKIKALELLGKHLKLFTDRVEHEGLAPKVMILHDGREVHFIKEAKSDDQD